MNSKPRRASHLPVECGVVLSRKERYLWDIFCASLLEDVLLEPPYGSDPFRPSILESWAAQKGL